MKKFTNRTAQSALEYTIILGLVAIVFVAVGPLFKRGIQAVIRLAADQMQTQANAEQKLDSPSGYLVNQYATSLTASDGSTEELYGVTRYTSTELEASTTNSLVNLGFTNRSN